MDYFQLKPLQKKSEEKKKIVLLYDKLSYFESGCYEDIVTVLKGASFRFIHVYDPAKNW